MNRTIPVLAGLLLATASATHPAAAAEITVMSFNVWGGGANEGKPIDETVAAIRAAGADVVGVQETRLEGPDCTAEACPAQGPSVAAALAEALGYFVHEQTAANDALWANAILSRWPISDPTENDLGVTIDVDGTPVRVLNIHLDDAPYQPYQLLGIEYGPYPFLATAAEAIAAAAETRGPALRLFEADLGDWTGVTLVFGDFNEPSHLDWTAAAAAAGAHPLPVAWPVSTRLSELGFVDALRVVHPDPVAKPAFTWTPTSSPADPADHHDRIDFVYVRGATVVDAGIVGEKAPEADIIVTPWPSDHRAVMARIAF
jgi:exodeoxyribonuclease-3